MAQLQDNDVVTKLYTIQQMYGREYKNNYCICDTLINMELFPAPFNNGGYKMRWQSILNHMLISAQTMNITQLRDKYGLQETVIDKILNVFKDYGLLDIIIKQQRDLTLHQQAYLIKMYKQGLNNTQIAYFLKCPLHVVKRTIEEFIFIGAIPSKINVLGREIFIEEEIKRNIYGDPFVLYNIDKKQFIEQYNRLLTVRALYSHYKKQYPKLSLKDIEFMVQQCDLTIHKQSLANVYLQKLDHKQLYEQYKRTTISDLSQVYGIPYGVMCDIIAKVREEYER